MRIFRCGRGRGPARRSVHEQMVHQCVSENLWFVGMLGIDVGAPPLPAAETRLEFMKRYAEDSGKRLAALRAKDSAWWESETKFFDVPRSEHGSWFAESRTRRTIEASRWRCCECWEDLHSNYGPTADTGGLMQNHAPTIYGYPSLNALFEGEAAGSKKTPLPGAAGKAVDRAPGQEIDL